jgi:hypothetical protein
MDELSTSNSKYFFSSNFNKMKVNKMKCPAAYSIVKMKSLKTGENTCGK